MEKFMFLFRGGMSDTQIPSPEAMQANMQKWYNWLGGLSKKGVLVGSEPLEPAGRQLTGTQKTVTDGPFVEAKETVGGYAIVTAKNLDEATEIAKGCPIFEAGGRLEIRQVRKIEMPA